MVIISLILMHDVKFYVLFYVTSCFTQCESCRDGTFKFSGSRTVADVMM